MDNVVHTLCALALSRAGKLGPWSTGTLVVASNVPDLDGVMLLWGDQATYLEQHRGITHALPGMLMEGALLGLAAVLLASRRGVRLRFMTLTAVAWLGLLVHLALDGLNSYGIRPWLPFDARWVYLDVAFVADPWIWLGLTVAAALGGPPGWRKASGWLALLLVGATLVFSTGIIPVAAGIIWCAAMLVVVLTRVRGVGVGNRPGMAWGGLVLTATYLAALAVGSRAAHEQALEALDARLRGPVEGTSINPQPGIPWRFRVVVQTPDRLHRATVDVVRGTVDGIGVQPRGLGDPELERVRHTPEYRVWMGFARHRFAGWWEDQLVLGDGRYSRLPEPSWSNLLVALPPARWSEEEVGIGVVFRQRRFAHLGGPQSVSVLEIDMEEARLRFADAGGLARTSVLGMSTEAIAAVNGGYFTAEGSAVGLLKIDNRLLFANTQARQAALGIDAEERLWIRPAPLDEWLEVRHALSAGPMLVVNGEVDVSPGFAHENDRHPRTAVGLTSDKLLLVTVDGRNTEAAGMSCAELARLMVDLGCHTALNLDGGGSTSMWVRSSPDDGVVNYPSDNRRFDHRGERAVGNAVLVLGTDVIVRDNHLAVLTPPGAWASATEGTGFMGEDYAFARDPNARATWNLDIDLPGLWKVMARWPRDVELTATATVAVQERRMDLSQAETGGEWVEVGELQVTEPTRVEIVLRALEPGALAADAVRLVQQR